MNGKIIGFFILLFFDLGFLLNFHRYSLENRIFTIIVTIITIGFAVKILIDRKKQISQKKLALEEEQENINLIRSGILPKRESSSLILKKDEYSCFECNTYMTIYKNKLVGSNVNNGGVSVRVAKGVYLRNGSSTSKAIYKNITERYRGIFAVTNKRIVFLNTQHGFEIPYEKLTGLFSSGNMLSIQAGNKGYNVVVTSPKVIEELIKKLSQE